MTWITIALRFLPTILGWFGIGGPVTVDPAKEGEALGRAQASAAANKETLDDLKRATEAGDRARASLRDDPSLVRDPRNPDARPWRPGPDV